MARGRAVAAMLAMTLLRPATRAAASSFVPKRSPPTEVRRPEALRRRRHRLRRLPASVGASSPSDGGGAAAAAAAEEDSVARTETGGWEGSVAHFVASVDSVGGGSPAPTVEDAIRSALSEAAEKDGGEDIVDGGAPSAGEDAAAAAAAEVERRRDCILSAASDPLISLLPPGMRHDPLSDLPPPPPPLGAEGGDGDGGSGRRRRDLPRHHRLSPVELLALGSVWYLPSSAPRDPARGGKPIRLSASDATREVADGDYLRIHRCPRRFPASSDVDWGGRADEGVGGRTPSGGTESGAGGGGAPTDGSGGRPTPPPPLPGAVVAEDVGAGYVVLDKPGNVPVHATVDNVLENVAAAVGRSILRRREAELRARGSGGGGGGVGEADDSRKRKRRGKQREEPLIYVATPQRLDQNTSGLLVVATKKSFAAYFAELLRRKTGDQLSPDKRGDCAVHKKYRCLVCVSPGGTASASDEIDRLRGYASDGGATIRHYLEPSIRAPKNFAPEPGGPAWYECLLRITNVARVCALVGTGPAESLSRSLWERCGGASRPPRSVACAEAEVELLTGRTHQIRGQMSAMGYPLVGDVQYGGAVPLGPSEGGGFAGSERLALQCSELEFLDPDFVLDGKGEERGVRSDRWRRFRLDGAWWTPLLDRYAEELGAGAGEGTIATTSADDADLVRRIKERTGGDGGAGDGTVPAGGGDADAAAPPGRSDLPPRVRLAPGLHKYVLIRAHRPGGGFDTDPLWFVRSASPAECGGPYHADVARGLVDELTDRGYRCAVTGGGRIDYNEYAPHAHVFGFSYGFGKGDHALAARVIEDWSEGETYATYDNSDGIY